jgi:2-desacetyl-2-hydroxyethyl bacteriochlorophyllide A dehydrogenase
MQPVRIEERAMPTKAREVAFTGPREVALQEVELPEPGPYQVLVRTRRTLVSAGTEVKLLLGIPELGRTPRYPVRPGYSNVGIVEQVGSAASTVTDVQPGDRVVTMGRHASHALINLDPNQFQSVAGQHGPAYIEKVPDGVSDEQAAFTILGSVALHGMRKVTFQLGESCLVLGQGVVGQMLGQLARAAGAAPVIGVDLVKARLEAARQGGIHEVVDASGGDAEEVVQRITGGRGADVCFEATTSARNFPGLMRMAALNGRIVVVGSLAGTAEISLFDEIQRKELTIIGAWQPRAPMVGHHTSPWTQRRNRQTFLELLKAGTVRVDHLITRRGKPEDAPRLYGEIAEGPGEWLAVILEW